MVSYCSILRRSCSTWIIFSLVDKLLPHSSSPNLILGFLVNKPVSLSFLVLSDLCTLRASLFEVFQCDSRFPPSCLVDDLVSETFTSWPCFGTFTSWSCFGNLHKYVRALNGLGVLVKWKKFAPNRKFKFGEKRLRPQFCCHFWVLSDLCTLGGTTWVVWSSLLPKKSSEIERKWKKFAIRLSLIE